MDFDEDKYKVEKNIKDFFKISSQVTILSLLFPTYLNKQNIDDLTLNLFLAVWTFN